MCTHKAQDKGLWVCVAHLSPRNPKRNPKASGGPALTAQERVQGARRGQSRQIHREREVSLTRKSKALGFLVFAGAFQWPLPMARRGRIIAAGLCFFVITVPPDMRMRRALRRL